jgi:hypothetical protein
MNGSIRYRAFLQGSSAILGVADVSTAHGRIEGALVTDEPTAYPHDDPAPAQQEPMPGDAETPPERSMWTLTSILLLVLIVLLAMLLFRGCVSGSRAGDEGGGKTIIAVEGAEPVPGVISIWVKDSADVAGVLRSSGVSADSIVALGEDRYLIVVREGVEDQDADRIAENASVYDVGRVYEDGVR